MNNCQETTNKENCPCPHTNCKNYGICCACIRAHRSSNSPVKCMKPFIEQLPKS